MIKFSCAVAACTFSSYPNMRTTSRRKQFHRFSGKRSQRSTPKHLPLFVCSDLEYMNSIFSPSEKCPSFFKLRIGIRSQDLRDTFERLVQGSSIALSSPRLVIPAAIYGCWGLSHNFASDLFDFQVLLYSVIKVQILRGGMGLGTWNSCLGVVCRICFLDSFSKKMQTYLVDSFQNLFFQEFLERY